MSAAVRDRREDRSRRRFDQDNAGVREDHGDIGGDRDRGKQGGLASLRHRQPYPHPEELANGSARSAAR